MNIFKAIGLGFVVLLAAVFVFGFFLPQTAHVERTVIIEQPKATVFEFLINYQNFTSWSPWHSIDPNTQYQFSGPASGVGARMDWQSSNPQVDKGWQQIKSIEGQELVEIELVFGNESGGGTVYYRLQEVDAGTEVTWEFDTDFGNNPFGRYIGLMMDGMLGPYYELGLANLKKVLEP